MTPSPLLQLPNTYRAFYGAFATLRPFQRDVIDPILNGNDIILQAATGSGKTEAVLAPCLERVIRSDRAEAILYVVPTRALVHDLRRRLRAILHERLGLHLGIRTGDVKRLPGGRADLLLTTPESLDVMLGSANREIRAFLPRVTMFVVDEVHQLTQGYRGRHLSYLVQRLEQRSQRRLQKIALSATLSGPKTICDSLALQPDAVWLSQAVQRPIQPHLVHLKREPEELVAFINDLVQRFGARKLLLFANSRSHCDQLFAWLSQRGYFQHSVFLHYSNLKLQQRQEVERQFQRRSQALCIATSTLELGIDVGDVDSVILYEPPESVTTFLQRLGRSNRQSHTTTFWGVCRGPRAGDQLLQFLALYTLAQQGQVEAMQPADLPSVLVQQVLSNLYERKRVSLAGLQNLYPQQAERLASLLPFMESRQWLRRLERHGHEVGWKGSWRYVEALKAYQIWSNFPDAAEPYTLQVEDQAVADLPPSIVRQLEAGDQVDLAGRCIRILDIQTGERKVVRAEPVTEPDGKVLYWVGTGAPVSWEVAQAVKSLLQPDAEPDAELSQGLFTRTRTLLQQERQRSSRRVVLHNGIELSRTPGGFYRYATYLGSVGNFILQRTIEAYYGDRLEDFSCSADAIAVTCSDRIDLQRLPLPIERGALPAWAAQHMQALQALFALNTFTRALPRHLLIEEATDLLWDERIAETFARYRRQTSEIAEGDPKYLEWEAPYSERDDQERLVGPIHPGPQPAILVQEQTRLGLIADAAPILPAVPAMHRTPRALTGTIVGNYMQHQQCDRLLSFDLLPYDQQPPKRALVDSVLGAARAGQGQAFEERVVEELAKQGVPLHRIPEEDEDGKRLSLQQRQDMSVAVLTDIVQAIALGQSHIGDEPEPLVGILVQPVLIRPSLTGTATPIDGIGIPDLIEVRVAASTVWLTIADIKDSVAPRYSQKWQVAFYAALLRDCLTSGTFALPVRTVDHGVLLTRPASPASPPARHVFELAPYLESVPLLRQRVNDLLTTPVAAAPWQLQPHCTSCAYLDTCYRQALSTDDVMLLPHLTPGEHLKLHTAGLHTLSQAADWALAEEPECDLPADAQQAERLRVRVQALTHNEVQLRSDITPLYPTNLSTVIFVHLLRDPSHGGPRVWGLHRLSEGMEGATPLCWIAATEDDLPACRAAFWAQLSRWWQEAITASRGPHLVTFGAASFRLLQGDRHDAPEPIALDIDGPGDSPHHTDLRRVLTQHFALPIPLRYTLATVARVWALTPELNLPPYLLQDEADEAAECLLNTELEETQVAQLTQYLCTHLALQQQVWQICTTHMQSDWTQSSWETAAADTVPALKRHCLAFLQQQQQWREQDILAVQQLPLAERVERYRALGPLEFEDTRLDAEGRFLAHFRLPPDSLPGRFRAGDFLRLNPMGSLDLQGGVGVILAQYDPHAQRLAVISRQGRLQLSSRLRYTLDEDLDDWTTHRVMHAVQEGLSPGKHPHVSALVHGTLPVQQQTPGLAWAQRWVRQVALNARQREALLLPFRSRLGLIEGPPGTGKTHLIACMLIALILEAAESGRPLRLVVSALTHQAIDNVLLKVQQLLREQFGDRFPGRCLKWGRRLSLPDDDDTAASALTYVEHAEDVLHVPYLILGATGFGLYNLFDSRSGTFPAFFDWVVFDEASQVVLPQAILSLIYGKGQYIFCGDVQQLPPVVRGPLPPDSDTPDDDEVASEARPEQSILAHLLAAYDPAVRVRLNETYRLNRELCRLPSRLWYDGDLRPTAANADSRLAIPFIAPGDRIDDILDPQRPATLVLAEHHTDSQQSAVEVEIMAALAARLLLEYGLEPAQLAILAPHRAQNNAIAQRLAQRLSASRPGADMALPVIDTVERLQGAERDVVLVSLTTSDPDHLESPFLNNPNRFNVSITRARHKLVVVGSPAFFTRVPRTEAGLLAHQGFTAYYQMCQAQHALFKQTAD